MDNGIAQLMVDNPILPLGFDWLIKSLMILGFTLCVCRVVKGESLSSSNRHLLWIYSIFCLALIPFADLTIGEFSTAKASIGNVFTFTVVGEYPVEPILTTASEYSIADILLYAYMVPVGLLLLRILIAIIAVLRIGKQASPVSNDEIDRIAKSIANKLELSRRVTVKQSREICSPFSFGLFFPEIILPVHASAWSPLTIENVLMHEFIHIKRLDWITMLICHVVSCVYWVNPLCWIALSRANEESESSCDAAALTIGQNAKDYAESLIYVARQSRDEHKLLVQMMANKHLLLKRINKVLEGPMHPASGIRRFQFKIPIIFALLVGVLGTLNLVSAQSAIDSQAERIPVFMFNIGINGWLRIELEGFEVTPIRATAAPIYPDYAMQRGISGGNLVSFSVTEDGIVDTDTIVIVGSEPPGIFETSTISAVAKIIFSPPTENGEKVRVNDIRMLFSYGLKGNPRNREYMPLNHITPQYPISARQQKIEGYVLVEFTVTREGVPFGIVILDHSPSDIFNASAINAAERFRFRPRVEDGVPVEAQGAQFLFNYKLDD